MFCLWNVGTGNALLFKGRNLNGWLQCLTLLKIFTVVRLKAPAALRSGVTPMWHIQQQPPRAHTHVPLCSKFWQMRHCWTSSPQEARDFVRMSSGSDDKYATGQWIDWQGKSREREREKRLEGLCSENDSVQCNLFEKPQFPIRSASKTMTVTVNFSFSFCSCRDWMNCFLSLIPMVLGVHNHFMLFIGSSCIHMRASPDYCRVIGPESERRL